MSVCGGGGGGGGGVGVGGVGFRRASGVASRHGTRRRRGGVDFNQRRTSSSASASDASVSDYSTLDLSSVSDQASLALRRRLASETLARGYLSMEAPCTVVHVVYVRRDRRVAPGVPWPMRETFGRPLFQVEGDTADHVLRDDLAHFLSLSLTAEKDVDCGVGMCEFRGTLDYESTQLDTASAAALLRECNDRSLRCRDFLGSLQLQDGTAATVRFQQFTEASALTMCIPNSAPEGRTLSPSTGEILDRLGPRFLAELPGEILLFANVAVVSRNDVLNISRNADCTTSQHFLETCVFPDGGLMCGMTGDGTGIQFVTDYNVDAYGALNVVCIHSCGTSTVGSEIVPEVFGDAQARMIQRFLEVSLHLSDNFVSTLGACKNNALTLIHTKDGTIQASSTPSTGGCQGAAEAFTRNGQIALRRGGQITSTYDNPRWFVR